MKIENAEMEDHGSFYIEEDGERIAELVYSMPEKNKMNIEHTEVDPSLRGKDVGRQLVNAAVEHARKNKIKIVPMCSFARSVFKRHAEYQDILA
jgi:predicted GNAT family acetyltransferase